MKIYFRQKAIGSINHIQLVAGSVFLICGLFIYLLVRCPDQIFFIYTFHLPSFYDQYHEKLFAVLSNNLPSFLHACSFSFLTCAFLPLQSRKKIAMVCLGWATINVLCEIGQLMTPNTNIPLPIQKNTLILKYFRYGTFDIMDIVFTLIGCCFAYCILIKTSKGGKNEII